VTKYIDINTMEEIMNRSEIFRRAANEVHNRYTNHDGVAAESCCAIYRVCRNLPGNCLSDAYGATFKPPGSPFAYWLWELSVKDREDFRLTALLLAAEMAETGDL
jgi:hypothetical protein